MPNCLPGLGEQLNFDLFGALEDMLNPFDLDCSSFVLDVIARLGNCGTVLRLTTEENDIAMGGIEDNLHDHKKQFFTET